jgi:hypothetical protein
MLIKNKCYFDYGDKKLLFCYGIVLEITNIVEHVLNYLVISYTLS